MVWYANAWIKVCKIRMFFLISAGFFPEYFVAIVINVYRARKNEQVVAKAVYVSQNVCLHGSGVRQRYYVAFGASCDCPRDIGRAASGWPPGRMNRLCLGRLASRLSIVASRCSTTLSGMGAGCQVDSASVARAEPISKSLCMALVSTWCCSGGMAVELSRRPSQEFSSSTVP